MRTIILLCLLLTACGGTATPTIESRLNGVWNSDLGSLDFDFPAGKVTGVLMGASSDQPLKMLSSQGDTALVQLGTMTVTLTLTDDERMNFAQDGYPPVEFRR